MIQEKGLTGTAKDVKTMSIDSLVCFSKLFPKSEFERQYCGGCYSNCDKYQAVAVKEVVIYDKEYFQLGKDTFIRKGEHR